MTSNQYFSNLSQRYSHTNHTQQIPSPSPSTLVPTQPQPWSAHFSNKVLQTQGNENQVHPLRHTWVFWFQHRSPGSKNTNYEEGIKRVSSFSSVESYWSLWTHLQPPSTLQPTTDYLLFHSGVKRPIWEDPLNANGGKWIIRLKKGVSDRLWEEVVMAVIGDQYVPSRGGPGAEEWAMDEICGCTISVRSNEDILAIWHKNGSDESVRLRIRDITRKILHLGPATIMEYKSNNDSMQDKSSFRTTPVVERTTSGLDRS